MTTVYVHYSAPEPETIELTGTALEAWNVYQARFSERISVAQEAGSRLRGAAVGLRGESPWSTAYRAERKAYAKFCDEVGPLSRYPDLVDEVVEEG